MKTIKRIVILFCCCMLAFVFAACGSSGSKPAENNELAKFAGEYSFFCTDIMGYHVQIEELEGTTTTLKEDGTGYLDWGEDNKGPISEWTVDDAEAGKITIKAGVATMEGTIVDGVLSIGMTDIITSVYALDGADTSGIQLMTPDELPADIVEDLLSE